MHHWFGYSKETPAQRRVFKMVEYFKISRDVYFFICSLIFKPGIFSFFLFKLLTFVISIFPFILFFYNKSVNSESLQMNDLYSTQFGQLIGIKICRRLTIPLKSTLRGVIGSVLFYCKWLGRLQLAYVPYILFCFCVIYLHYFYV